MSADTDSSRKENELYNLKVYKKKNSGLPKYCMVAVVASDLFAWVMNIIFSEKTCSGQQCLIDSFYVQH